MERPNSSPSLRIYKMYDEFEKRGKDTSVISQAIQQATGTVGKSNLEVVTGWIEEMSDSQTYKPF